MGERAPTNVLVTGAAISPEDGLLSVIEAAGFEVRSEPWHSEIPALVESQVFDAIIVLLPLPGVGLGVLLSSIRSRAARCRQAGLVILAPVGELRAVEKLVGRGVNRVLPNTASAADVLEALGAVQGAARRVTVKLPVQLEVTLPAGESQAFCQTENVSESGMLLRGFQHFPIGTRFSFHLHIPGTERTLKGVAEVARRTDSGREKVEGFGARFIEVESSEWVELEKILEDKDNVDPIN